MKNTKPYLLWLNPAWKTSSAVNPPILKENGSKPAQRNWVALNPAGDRKQLWHKNDFELNLNTNLVWDLRHQSQQLLVGVRQILLPIEVFRNRSGTPLECPLWCVASFCVLKSEKDFAVIGYTEKKINSNNIKYKCLHSLRTFCSLNKIGSNNVNWI